MPDVGHWVVDGLARRAGGFALNRSTQLGGKRQKQESWSMRNDITRVRPVCYSSGYDSPRPVVLSFSSHPIIVIPLLARYPHMDAQLISYRSSHVVIACRNHRCVLLTVGTEALACMCRPWTPPLTWPRCYLKQLKRPREKRQGPRRTPCRSAVTFVPKCFPPKPFE